MARQMIKTTIEKTGFALKQIQRMLAIPFIKRLSFRHCNLQNISRISF